MTRDPTVRKGQSRWSYRPNRVRDDGSVSVWMLAAGVVTVMVAAGFAAAGSAVAARHQAGGTADLAALAGAAYVIDGEPYACDQAARIASANGAQLVGCRLVGWDIVVTVEVTPAGPAGLVGSARVSARAGPADESPPTAESVVSPGREPVTSRRLTNAPLASTGSWWSRPRLPSRAAESPLAR